MNMQTMSEILSMSGYGGYVWSAFGVVFVVLLGLFLMSRTRLKKALRIQRQLLAEQR